MIPLSRFNCLYFIVVSVCQKFKQLRNNPVFKHCQLVIVFFIFSVALLSADIVTDIVSAVDFFKRGHTYWGLFTLVPIFAPFAVRSVITLIGFCQCFEYKKIDVTPEIHFYLPKINMRKNKYIELLSELKQLPWHFPMFQPIRQVSNYDIMIIFEEIVLYLYHMFIN